jgi:hypothetical protein
VTTKARAATIRGTFLAPGVSANGRQYTKENIGKAVLRMQAAIADGSAPPLSQLTSHGTDDVLNTVGRLTKVWQASDGSAKFESDVPDTANGRDMAVLTKHGYIKNVSISGRWLGDVKNVEIDGQSAETAEDLEVVRVDFVPRPGVSAARIDDVALAEGEPLGDWRDDVTSETALVAETVNTTTTYTTTGPAIETPSKETPVTEEAKTTEAKGGLSESDVAKIAEAVSKSNADLVEKLIAAQAKVSEKGPEDDPKDPEPANPAPALAETEEQRFARYFEAKKAELVQQFVKENGTPPRQGLVVTEGAADAKPLHEMSPDEFRKALTPVAEAVLDKRHGLGVVYPGINREA